MTVTENPKDNDTKGMIHIPLDTWEEFEDRIKNPSMFSSPRSLKLALGINF